ncbi:MAG: hypothetical protein ACPH2K_01590 [Flavicella sp.]
MKRFSTFGTIFFILLLSFSCRKDFSTIPSNGNLLFSRDTVFLDTVFTNTSSSTYALKVYNEGSKDVHIPSIQLGRSNSFYRLNVDGVPGKKFENVLLRSDDSLYIFIETTIDYSKISSPLYTDSIVFDAGTKLQDVKLVTLVQDAHFIYKSSSSLDTMTITPKYFNDKTPKSIRYLSDSELNFTEEKPYVIYGYCAVPEGKTLHIEAGSKLYFHKNSALVVGKDASLQVSGTLDKNVCFEGDRLEFSFEDVSGQWDGIWLQSNSANHSINHAYIKNASIGIVCDSIQSTSTTPSLTLKNTKILNNSQYGILAKSTHIKGENLILGNSRISALAIEKGGKYDFNHTNIVNYWTQSIRRSTALQIKNTVIAEDEASTDIDLRFSNSIISGSRLQEIYFDKDENSTFECYFTHCYITANTADETPLYDTSDTSTYNNCLFNGILDFKDTYVNDFRIGEESVLIEKASTDEASRTPLDLIETERLPLPDIGAYQHIVFEEPEEEVESE